MQTNRIITIIFMLLLFEAGTSGQSISAFLEQVRSNHPGIIAARDLMEAGIAGTKTGNTPPGPELEAGWFPGHPESIGTKTTWSVTQSFDFPTRYTMLKKLRKTNMELARLEYDRTILELMRDAGIEAIEMVAELKKRAVLQKRMDNLKKLQLAYDNLLENGEVTIIDRYKLRQQVIEMQNNINESEERLIELKYWLDLVSGNHSDAIINAGYPVMREPDPDSLLTIIQALHPGWRIPDLRVAAAEREIGLSKSENMPSISVGYASEKVINEDFIGPTLGISIPLWENKGKVDYARAARNATISESSGKLVKLENNFRKEYELMTTSRDNLQKIRELDPTLESVDLLTKALDEGEMSMTEFLIELTSFYHIENTMMELEKKYYQSLFQLYDYTLVN